jgi:tRNA-uridine 2-sulfurtransferase
MTLPKVVVAMSGGVDSSVAAALLVEQGYQVTGMMLRLWSEPGSEESNRCCTPDAMALARRVAAKLGIPFYAVDAQQRFRDVVVQSFLDGYARGLTPNPCIFCNREIRWGILMDRARAMGAEYMATGHYARISVIDSGQVSLLRGEDPAKDQSYVLSVLSQEQLRHTKLPIGEYTKPQIREIARRYNFPVADRPDSQDLCFLAGQDYRQFLGRYIPEAVRPGHIINRQGMVLGEHDGLAFYTIGQRKGIRISASQPLYVIEKDRSSNSLVVGTLDELGQSSLEAQHVNWISGDPPLEPVRAEIKIRYHAKDALGMVTPQEDNCAAVSFDQPLRDITAGQRVVFYQGETCLGGGTIQG